MSKHPNLSLAAMQLNASTGQVVTYQHVAKALSAGSVNALADAPIAAALIGYMFVELEPRLITLCAAEAESDVAHAHQLYMESVSHALPRVPAWEAAVAYLI